MSPLPQVRVERPPETDDELYELVYTLWGVRIPRYKVCPDHVAPFTAFANAYFARDPVSVWKASRGMGGKSRTLSYLVLTEAATLGADVNILGGSAAQSVNIHEAMHEGWDNPLAPKGMVEHTTKYGTTLTNGARVRALTASQRSVRGPHPQRLRLDEIDEMDLEILDAAMGQPMPGKGLDTQTVMSSTHQYADGTMTAILHRAQDRGWPSFEWCFRETSNPQDGWLSTEFIERKKREVTRAMWNIEYDLQEPMAGARAFDTDAVEAMFHLDPHVPEQRVLEKPEVFTFEPPQPRAFYVTGADWAKSQDYSVFTTWRTDVKPWRLVKFYRGNRLPWPVMTASLDAILDEYGGRCYSDATGVGAVVSDLLRHKVTNIILSGRVRDDILSDYVGAIEKGHLEAPRVEWMYREHKFATLEDLYGRGSNHHVPDSVVSAALAYHGRGREIVRVRPPSTQGQDLVRALSPWKASGT